METQVSLIAAFSSSAIFGLLEPEVLQNYWETGGRDVGFQKKHNAPTQQIDDIAPQIIKDCGNLTTGFKHLWSMSFSTLPPDSRTLGFPNGIQKLALMSEKRELWTTGNSPISFLSLSPVRRL